jgi:hypothetical protein
MKFALCSWSRLMQDDILTRPDSHGKRLPPKKDCCQ